MFNTFKQQKILSALNDIAIIFPALLIILTWRGYIKALVAKVMGDDTAQREGFLTLNPLAHVDVFGLTITMGIFFAVYGLFYNIFPQEIILLILIVLGVRWIIPVPLDEKKFKHHRVKGIITSLSGPISMFLLAFLTTGLMKLTITIVSSPTLLITLIQIFKTITYFSLFFCFIHLIPLPPFDGGKALRYVLPSSAQPVMNFLEKYSFFIILILIFAPGISSAFFDNIIAITNLTLNMLNNVFFK